ncbi:MAG: response regulator [Candidatus Eisenbacteria bacterium]|nr:response regulator [Candidatus Eisenbacteria bacterium]
MHLQDQGPERPETRVPPPEVTKPSRMAAFGWMLLSAVTAESVTSFVLPSTSLSSVAPLVHALVLTLAAGPIFWWSASRFHRRAQQRIAFAALESGRVAEIDRARFEMTLAIGNIGAWEMAPATGAFFGDARWAQIFGFEPRDGAFPVDQAVDRLHPDDREGAWTSHQEHERDHTPHYEYRFRVRQADDSYRWCISRGRIVERDAEGRAARTVGVTIDIHDQALREEREREARALLGRIMELIPYNVFWKDENSVFLGCNQAFAESAGLTHPDEIVGLTDYDLPWSVEETEAYRADDAKVMSSGEARMHVEEAITNSDGETSWVDTSKVALRDLDGNLFGVLGVFADITETRMRQLETQRLREAAEAASHAKSSFLANMSHEIRTPLAAILGYADLLHDDLVTLPEAENYLESITAIRNSGHHLLTVVNDVLDISKIEAGRLEVAALETDLPDLLRAVESLLQPLARGKGIELRFDLDSPIPTRVFTDPTRLRQIVLNVVGNAIKFTELGSVIVTIHGESKGETTLLCFDVQDTGVGMTAAGQQQLFEPFGQADASLTRQFGGTGLGLAIARRLARLLGGDVQLVSSERGQGSHFHIEIGCRVASDSMTEHLGGQSPQGGTSSCNLEANSLTARVLYAEDGPLNQKLIAGILSRVGARVDLAENGEVALKRIHSATEPYDLLITDIQMPVMDGYELARTLRSEGVQIPILALTAHAMPEDRARCLESGCDAYLSKPVDRAALLRNCNALLSGNRDTSDSEAGDSENGDSEAVA